MSYSCLTQTIHCAREEGSSWIMLNTQQLLLMGTVTVIYVTEYVLLYQSEMILAVQLSAVIRKAFTWH